MKEEEKESKKKRIDVQMEGLLKELAELKIQISRKKSVVFHFIFY